MNYQCRMNLKTFGWLAFVLCVAFANAEEVSNDSKPRTIKVALVQFDSVPEKVKHNLDEMQRLVRSAVKCKRQSNTVALGRRRGSAERHRGALALTRGGL